MAITFTGSFKSQVVLGNDALIQNLLTIENGPQSRVDLHVLRLAGQLDMNVVLTSVSAILRTARAGVVSGGVILDKQTHDTSQTSDPNVIVRAPVAEGAQLTATANQTLWQQFPGRFHTLAEQILGNDKNLIPLSAAQPEMELVLRPGESLVTQVRSAAVAANAANSMQWLVMGVIEENSIATFNISGTVTLSGSPVSGAKVFVMEADDDIGTNAHLHEVITTGAGGTWASTIRSDRVGIVSYQYKNGATLYTAPGSPYLQP